MGGGGGQWTDAGAYLKPNTDGDGIRLYDGGGTDYIEIDHDGSYGLFSTNAGGLQFGTASSDIHGMNTAPVTNQMFTALADAGNTTVFKIDGTTNPYTADMGFITGFHNLRTYGGTGTMGGSLTGAKFDTTFSHAMTGTVSSPMLSANGISNTVTHDAAHTATVTGSLLDGAWGISNSITKSGTITADKWNWTMYGSSNSLTVMPTLNNGSGTYQMTNYGMYANINNMTTLTAGTLTVNDYGVYSYISGTTNGTSTGYALYGKVNSAYDTNWNLYLDGTLGDAFMGGDDLVTYWGTDYDASITFDGTNLVIDAQASGSGLLVLNTVKTTTGDPTGVEGLIYWNTVDNVIKMYADSGWRTLASW